MKGIKVKKLGLLLIVFIIFISMVAMFTLSGCKEGAVTETTAAEATEAETTAAATETSVVAGEEELYIFCQPGNGIEILQTYAWGGYIAEQYWKALGVNVKFEWTGPDDFDAEKLVASLEASIAKNPVGILFWPIGFGEDNLLTDYYNGGGLIAGMNGSKGQYPVDFIIGTNNVLLGQKLAEGMVAEMGETGKIGVILNIGNPMANERWAGAKSVLDKYPGIEVLEPVAMAETREGTTANAAAFLAAHPDVNGLMGTASMDGACWARAMEEAGIEPGLIKCMGVDKDADTLDLIDKGYLQFSISQNFPVESFYAISILHMLHTNPLYISNDDTKALGRLIPGCEKVDTILNKITKDNTANFRGILPPEGWSLTTGRF